MMGILEGFKTYNKHAFYTWITTRSLYARPYPLHLRRVVCHRISDVSIFMVKPIEKRKMKNLDLTLKDLSGMTELKNKEKTLRERRANFDTE